METIQATAAPEAGTIVVGNPQSGTAKLTGTLTMVINGIEDSTPARFEKGSVDAYGNLVFPQGSITISPLDVYGVPLIFTPTANATGTINPGAAGTNMTLTLVMILELGSCGSQNISCTLSGTYKQATGGANLTVSGVTVEKTACASVNLAGGLPTSDTSIALTGTASPVIVGPVVAETESNNTSSTANVLPADTTMITGTFSSVSDVDNFKINLASGKTITLTQSVTRTDKVTCDDATTHYSGGALFKGTANGVASTSSTPLPTGHIVWVDCGGDGEQTPTGTSTATWTTTLKYRNGMAATQSVLLVLRPNDPQLLGSYRIQVAIR
jgi:hypothetical protein